MRGQLLPQPLAAVPAVSDRPLQRALRRPDRQGRISGQRAACGDVPRRQKRRRDRRADLHDGARGRRLGLREGRTPARSGFHAQAPAREELRAGCERRSRRDRLPHFGRRGLRVGHVLPQRRQSRFARLLPEAAARRRHRRCADLVHRAVLRRQAGAARTDRRARAARCAVAGAGVQRAGRARSRNQAQRACRTRALPRTRGEERRGCAGHAAGEQRDTARALRVAARTARARRNAAAPGVLRHQPHDGRGDRRLMRRLRSGRADQGAVPALQHHRHRAGR